MNKATHKPVLTDVHCHLLPGIDDGAVNEQASLNLLKIDHASGVRQIALTSHFNYRRTSLDHFLKARTESYKRLQAALELNEQLRDDLKLKLGAEVYYTPSLVDLDIKKLCISGTPFLLIELSTSHMPSFLMQTLSRIQAQGIIPILVHIERYPYIMEDLSYLCDLVDQGIYVQVNAETLIRGGKTAKLCLKMIDWDLVHLIASDAHSIDKRPPNLARGMDVIAKQLSPEYSKRIAHNSNLIFKGIPPQIPSIYRPKKTFGRWR